MISKYICNNNIDGKPCRNIVFRDKKLLEICDDRFKIQDIVFDNSAMDLNWVQITIVKASD